MLRLTIDPARPDPIVLERAAGVIRAGGLVAIPTDTLYGLAADPFNPDAVARVFAVKKRDRGKPLPLVAFDTAQVRARLGELSRLAGRLADHYWPGPLTLVIPSCGDLAPDVTAGTGRVAVRVPAHEVARGLCRAVLGPLTATSANVSGRTATRLADAMAGMEDVELLLDAGATPGGPPSTIVDTTGPEPRLVRAGAIRWEEIEACLRLG